MTWTSIKTLILQSPVGDLPCVSNPYNLNCIPKFLNLPFPSSAAVQEMDHFEDQHKLHHEEVIG